MFGPARHLHPFNPLLSRPFHNTVPACFRRSVTSDIDQRAHDRHPHLRTNDFNCPPRPGEHTGAHSLWTFRPSMLAWHQALDDLLLLRCR
ncbi:unnamed protein product [Zymoseptoria tritici ST99CH_1A5]|uniref:Uncharacterized protein n=1 Tax=Zymoseptoria tritici ST99CH_1A5 TaxID=1276529 RepID=A0A1Y6LWL4_ZYMTR|nr:unnamed protein product [Zymoseptoria tritici ST99CH_1A5]